MWCKWCICFVSFVTLVKQLLAGTHSQTVFCWSCEKGKNRKQPHQQSGAKLKPPPATHASLFVVFASHTHSLHLSLSHVRLPVISSHIFLPANEKPEQTLSQHDGGRERDAGWLTASTLQVERRAERRKRHKQGRGEEEKKKEAPGIRYL